MEQSKLFNIPLCDLSISNVMKQFRKPSQETACVRVSKRISNIQRKMKEVKSESSTEEETSEIENETPEKKTNIQSKNKETSKRKMKEIKSESSAEEETSEIENETPEKKTNIQSKNKETSKDDEKSDYEKMIEINRARSLAFLESLQLDEVKKSFSKSVHDLKPKRKPQNIKRPAPSSPPLRRKSRRLAKKDLDLSEDAVCQRAIAEAMKETKIEKPQELPKVLPFEEALKGKEIFSRFVHDYSELECKTERSYEFMSHIKNMKTCQSQIAKVVPGRITALTIHPVCDKIIICASSKYGHVGFWNMNCDSNPYVFAPHIEGITNIMFNPYDFNQVLSSSYDGTLRCGDMKKHVFDVIYSVSNKVCCTYFDVLSKTTFIVAQGNGEVALVDKRASKKSVKIHTCHDYSVKSVCVHPLNKNYFISSEIKGSIKLWDLRKLQKQPLSDVGDHLKSVTSAFFSPVTGNSILSTSLDDSLCIYDSSNLGGDISLKKSIKHKIYALSSLSAFKAIWVPYTDDTFVVGSMLYPRRIEVFNENGDNIYNFTDEDVNTITILHAFHPSLPVLAGGNSSGKVFAFTDTA